MWTLAELTELSQMTDFTKITNVEFELTPDGVVPEHIQANHSLYSKVPQVALKGASKDTLEHRPFVAIPNVDSSGVVLPSYVTKRNRLHLEWAGFLATQNWQWFVTFTFKEEIHPESADKLFRVWVNKVNREIYGQRWRKKASGGIKWVRALEWQKRGVLHYHALVANVGYASREKWAAEWAKLGEDSKAGFIRIDQYDDTLGGAEAYLSKYVAKDGDIDLSQNFQAQNIIPDHEQRRTKDFGDVANP